MAPAKHPRSIRRMKKSDFGKAATSPGDVEPPKTIKSSNQAKLPKEAKASKEFKASKFAEQLSFNVACPDGQPRKTMRPYKASKAIQFPDLKNPPTWADIPESRHAELAGWCRDTCKYWAELKWLGKDFAGSITVERKPWNQFLDFLDDHMLGEMRSDGPMIILLETDKVGKLMAQIVFLVLLRRGYFSEHNQSWWAIESGNARYMRTQEHLNWVHQQQQEEADKELFPEYDPRFGDPASLFEEEDITQHLSELMILPQEVPVCLDVNASRGRSEVEEKIGGHEKEEEMATPRPSRPATPAPGVEAACIKASNIPIS